MKRGRLLKIILTIILTSFSLSIGMSQTFTVNGFNFNVLSTNPNEVEVTGGSDGSSPLTIPSTVTDNGITYTVTTIGNSAYRNGTSSVILPNTITTIKFRAFRNNGGLTTITLPASVTTIEGEAFAFGGLVEIIALGTVPASISNSSFSNRSTIDLTVPNGSEEDYFNAGWTGFKTVNGEFPLGGDFTAGDLQYKVIGKNPNRVSVLGRTNTAQTIAIPAVVQEPVFSDNYTVEEVNIRAFKNASLTSVVFPNTLKIIGVEAFENNNLTTVTFPASLTEINDKAFRTNLLTEVISQAVNAPTIVNSGIENRNDISLTIPNGSEANYVSANWTGFFSVNGTPEIGVNYSVDGFNYTTLNVSPNEVRLNSGNASNTDLVIPSTVTKNGITLTTTVIKERAYRFDNLNSVVLPNLVETIEAEAFQGNNLTTITLPSTLTTINARAFRGNPLTFVEVLATTPPSIENSSIEDRNLIDLAVPNGLENTYIAAGWTGFRTINGNLFEGNVFEEGNFQYQVLSKNPNTVELLGQLTGAQNIVIPTTVTSSIGNNETFTIVSIGTAAFENANLSSVVMSNTITTISTRAFRNNNLTSITLPSNIETIGVNAFRENQIGNVSFPASLTTLGAFAFQSNALTSITIPSSITVIESNTFDGNLLTSITIPSNITSIGANAFIGNPLTSVTATSATPATVDSSSFGTRTMLPLTIIPDQATVINDYLNNGWTGFASINGTFNVGGQFIEGDFTYEVTSIAPETVKIINRVTTTQNITIPNTILETTTSTTFAITAIDNNAFQNTDITDVLIGSNISTIGVNAFATSSLATVEALGNTPATIDVTSFGTRENIALRVPTGTETAYENAGWTGFFSINGNGITVGNQFTFNAIRYEILSLSPNTLKAIGRDGDVPNGDFIFPELVSKGGIDFTITIIGNSAYRNRGVRTVSFPSTLTTIEFRAFRDNNNLLSVTIPENITTIGGEAFFGGGLREVISEGSTPASISNSSFGSRTNVDVFIPSGTTQAYENAGWIGYKSLIEQGTTILEPKVYLQGAFFNPTSGEETLMRDNLRIAGLIPTTSPYNDALTCNSNVFNATGNNAIVDWVFVELRDAVDNTTIVEGRSALLQRDGDVVDVNGLGILQFASPTSNYFVAIRHRNHLGVMTANVQLLTGNRVVLDFTNATNPITFGSNAQTIAAMPVGTLGMWAGNVNGDTIVQYSGTTPDAPEILSLVLNDPGNFLNFSTFIVSGYNTNDLTMDGSIQYEGVNPDSPFILQNVLAHPGNFLNFSTFQIQEQLPEN